MNIESDSNDVQWGQWLKPNDHLLCSHMTSEPRALLASLAKSGLPDGLTLALGTPFSLDAQAIPPAVSITVLGGMGSASRIARERDLQIDRENYFNLTRQYATGVRSADVVLVSLAAGKSGGLHLGAAHGPALEAASRARHVIAEINSQAPVITGAPWPTDINLSLAVQTDYAIAGIESPAATSQQELQIAEHLAELIPDAACLQVGIGSLPAAILSSLNTHRHLGVHTGMLTDSLYKLIQHGVVDNANKPKELRHTAIGSVYGSTRLYAEVAENPEIMLTHPMETHSPDVLQQINRFTAINSTIEVDLQGRVNAESVQGKDGNRRYVGGVGGLPNFVRGALSAKDGMSVIALPALTRYNEDARSRIVGSLTAEVTLDETLADIVVTEHGVAQLRNASPAQRRERMIAIADPSVREWLANEA